tara:strand:+ start:50 stop:316 length:267 start_codon:yes stop_codon:yes gene_type:complete
MNNSTYELLTQQLKDKDKRIDFLERLVEKNGQDSNPYRDDIDYRKAGYDFLEVMNAYLEAQQDDMLFDPSQELHKLYEDLHNIYWNIV